MTWHPYFFRYHWKKWPVILALTWIKEQRRNSSITVHLNKVLPKSTKQRSTVNEYMCFITLLYPQSHSDDSQYICHATARLSLQSAIQRCSLASWTAHRLCENKQPPLECCRATADCYQRTSEAKWSRTTVARSHMHYQWLVLHVWLSIKTV